MYVELNRGRKQQIKWQKQRSKFAQKPDISLNLAREIITSSGSISKTAILRKIQSISTIIYNFTQRP